MELVFYIHLVEDNALENILDVVDRKGNTLICMYSVGIN